MFVRMDKCVSIELEAKTAKYLVWFVHAIEPKHNHHHYQQKVVGRRKIEKGAGNSDPSGIKIWVALPGKEFWSAEVLSEVKEKM